MALLAVVLLCAYDFSELTMLCVHKTCCPSRRKLRHASKKLDLLSGLLRSGSISFYSSFSHVNKCLEKCHCCPFYYTYVRTILSITTDSLFENSTKVIYLGFQIRSASRSRSSSARSEAALIRPP